MQWNKVEHALKDSKELTGKSEECSDSKGIKSVLNGRAFKYSFGEVGFVCFLNPVKFLTAFV